MDSKIEQPKQPALDALSIKLHEDTMSPTASMHPVDTRAVQAKDTQNLVNSGSLPNVQLFDFDSAADVRQQPTHIRRPEAVHTPVSPSENHQKEIDEIVKGYMRQIHERLIFGE